MQEPCPNGLREIFGGDLAGHAVHECETPARVQPEIVGVMYQGEARRLGTHTRALREVYATPARLVRKDREQTIHGPSELLAAVLAEGEKPAWLTCVA